MIGRLVGRLSRNPGNKLLVAEHIAFHFGMFAPHWTEHYGPLCKIVQLPCGARRHGRVDNCYLGPVFLDVHGRHLEKSGDLKWVANMKYRARPVDLYRSNVNGNARVYAAKNLE